jgi:hypothetical protein
MMRVVQTQEQIPLSAVKPLDGLMRYRQHCLEATRRALREGAVNRRDRSPIGGFTLVPVGEVEGLLYGRCPQTGSLFLTTLPQPPVWARLLADVSAYRRTPEAFHVDLAQSRTDNVYAPKIEWIREALRLQGVHQPRLLEVTTAPSTFTPLLEDSGLCSEVVTTDETALAQGLRGRGGDDPVQVAVLLESLDRVHDPAGLLRGVAGRLEEGGLLFVTSLVSSGFDLSVLGLKNLYLYPPDRTNCFSLEGLRRLVKRSSLFDLVEVSTPGVLDVQIIRAHLQRDPSLPLSAFERQLIEMNDEGLEALQAFLQQRRLSSFARIVARSVPGRRNLR